MKKLLLALGLINIVSTILANTNTLQTQSYSPQIARKEIKISNQHAEGNVLGGQALFTSTTINLTTHGIPGINQLHNQYDFIEFPDLKIYYNNKLYIHGDQWLTKKRTIGLQEWQLLFTEKIGGSTANVYTTSQLWHENDTGEFKMTLFYRVAASWFTLYAKIETGEKVIIY